MFCDVGLGFVAGELHIEDLVSRIGGARFVDEFRMVLFELVKRLFRVDVFRRHNFLVLSHFL